jgi:maltooligosyltrehalose trehalohydrolase
MGANVVPGGVEFRVWAPRATTIDVELGNIYIAMTRGEDAVWAASVQDVNPGTHYRFRIDGEGAFPDPYSRSQPEGPHGPSQVVDPTAFAWTDGGWGGLAAEGLVLYECHVGTYTPEGTFDALIGELDALQRLGVTALELMPVAEFPGTRNWGYDGVDLFAPSHNYGGPEALRRLVDAAHRRGIGVILDVVYNHFGPDGNYLGQYSTDYLTNRYETAWGDAVNYDGAGSQHVRQLVIDNACNWIDEFHIDGLRLDATFAIFDASPRHILEEVVSRARACAAPRRVVMIAETHENDVRYLRAPTEGGFGFDATWTDDYHHAVHTAASQEHMGYYEDYSGSLDELARTINRGWLFEGQHSKHLAGPRGTRADGVPARAFVYFIQNHDQVGNRAFGRRFSHLVGAGAHKMWSALTLLLPYTPMLFMGQEFAASSRFHYFTDHNEELGRQVTEGRRREFASFAAFADPGAQREIPDPQAIETFYESKLDLGERDEGLGAQVMQLTTELLALRRSDAVLQRQDRTRLRATAAGDDLLLVQLWHGREHRLIVANRGVAVDAPPRALRIPGALLALDWAPVISTEERRFGGAEDVVRFGEHLVSIPPHTVALLRATQPVLPLRLLRMARRLVQRGAGDWRAG